MVLEDQNVRNEIKHDMRWKPIEQRAAMTNFGYETKCHPWRLQGLARQS